MVIVLLLGAVSLLLVALSDTHHTSTVYIVSQNRNNSYLTLSELAENISNYHTKTNLVLQQGNHSLQLEIAFRNISSVSIVGSGPPSGIYIKCDRQGRLSFESIDYVEVSNLIFENCRSHQIRLVSQFMLKYCIFQNHVETAMMLYKSSGYITSTSFVLNSANRLSFNQNGGAMIVTQSNVTIENCTFWENSAERGGAIFGESKHYLLIRC
jgi:predicted outer membrane repeat protein